MNLLGECMQFYLFLLSVPGVCCAAELRVVVLHAESSVSTLCACMSVATSREIHIVCFPVPSATKKTRCRHFKRTCRGSPIVNSVAAPWRKNPFDHKKPCKSSTRASRLSWPACNTRGTPLAPCDDKHPGSKLAGTCSQTSRCSHSVSLSRCWLSVGVVVVVVQVHCGGGEGRGEKSLPEVRQGRVRFH